MPSQDFLTAKMGHAFDLLDTDGDGILTEAELKQAVVEYFTSSDPQAPGNWLFGRPPVTA